MTFRLRDDETVVLETRPHWSVLTRRAAMAAAALIAAAVVGFVWSPDRGDDRVDIAAGAVAALFVVRLVVAVVRRRNTSVVLTDRRIVTSTGIGGRTVTSVPLSRVGGVSLRRGAVGRVLGYGTVVLTPLWGEGESILERMPRPRRLQRAIADLLLDPPDQVPAPVSPLPEDEDTGPLPRVIV
ncbi:MAG TPA: PH domain-containing protein [Actinomycetota bacterium]|nr:PH domain-containing protein [Actinomycetota bacterium]